VVVKGGYILTRAQRDQIGRELGPSEVQITEDLSIGPVTMRQREGGMMRLNHSCEPNLGLQGQVVFVALRDIEADEELTGAYAMTDDEPYEMKCWCGTPSYRGTITGFDWLKPLALKAYRPGVAARVKPFFDGICGVRLIPLVLLLAFANVDKIYQIFGTRGILAGLLLIMAGFGIGWLLGGSGAATRRVLALGTGQRNIAAALVVASESFSDPKVLVMVIVVTIVGLLTLVPICHVLAYRRLH
jgi:hypothetical protein